MNSTPNADPRIAAYAESAQSWRDSALEHIAYAARYKGLLREAICQLRDAGKCDDAQSLSVMCDAVEQTAIPAIDRLKTAPSPYPNESWREIADHQLCHDPTPAQEALHSTLFDGADLSRIGLVHGE